MRIIKMQHLAPDYVLGELAKNPTIKNNPQLVKCLAEASKYLADANSLVVEKTFADELAGTIAVLVSKVCCGDSKSAIVMVCDPLTKRQNASLLVKVVNALHQMGFLPQEYTVTVKYPKHKYMCKMRHSFAAKNNSCISDKMAGMTTVMSLNPVLADKICVRKCKNSCSYYADCRYQHILKLLSSGDAKIQVYDERQYYAARDNSQLPKARIAVSAATGRRAQDCTATTVLTERELKSLIARCETDCGRGKAQKRFVFESSFNIQNTSAKLFAMATEGHNVAASKKHIKQIYTYLKCIYDNGFDKKRIERFREGKKDELLSDLFRLIRKCHALLECEIEITHKNRGKRALVAA